jgi:predicted KAP-like P-loop ATPase
MTKKSVPTSSSFLSDNETKIDLLSNESIATTIINLLLEHPDRPVTIGIHGDWGAGKSSVLEMIEAGLAKQDGVLCVKFNGWRFQGFEDAKISFLEGIVTGLMEKRPTLSKAAEKVKSVFKRIDWLKVAKSAGSLALTAFTGIPTLTQVQTLVSTLETMFRDPASRPPSEKIDAIIDEAHSLLKPDSQSKNVPEEISGFRKAFD